MNSHASRMGAAPKWPMSAYSASPPVNARNTAPSTASDCAGCVARNCTAQRGSIASSTCGFCTIWYTPDTASTPNHSTITGPNTRPTDSVPLRCTRNRPISTSSVIGTT